MKKILFFLIIIFIASGLFMYYQYENKFLFNLDDNKIYEVRNVNILNIENLERVEFYKDGIVTYNNQNIKYLDFNNNIKWENKNNIFSNKIFITDEFIFRSQEMGLEMINNSNEIYVIPEINGEILNVSRENNETFIVTKQNNGQNTIYILNENNELVENKNFDNLIISVSLSDKSEGYSLVTLDFENGAPNNNIFFNLLDDVELWNVSIENELVLDTEIINNNVLIIGTENIYYYNTNGKLMWKNSNYNKVLDFIIDKKNKKIHVLYNQDNEIEVMSYNLEGKIVGVSKVPDNMKKIKVYNDKIFVYNDFNIYICHDNKNDKLTEESLGEIFDFYVMENNIYILYKDKLVKGQIKY